MTARIVRKVSNWANVRHGVPQVSILGHLLFLLYINYVPKIINKTSAPVIFSDDTSILFAHSNVIDLNTLGTGYLNCLYAYKRKSASPVLNVLTKTFA
jgi:hypothetical protein